MTRLEELDALIAAGWGEVPQNKIPEDWPSRKPPGQCRRCERHAVARGLCDTHYSAWRRTQLYRFPAQRTGRPRKPLVIPELEMHRKEA